MPAIDRFETPAKGEKVVEEYGFTVKNVVTKVKIHNYRTVYNLSVLLKSVKLTSKNDKLTKILVDYFKNYMYNLENKKKRMSIVGK